MLEGTQGRGDDRPARAGSCWGGGGCNQGPAVAEGVVRGRYIAAVEGWSIAQSGIPHRSSLWRASGRCRLQSGSPLSAPTDFPPAHGPLTAPLPFYPPPSPARARPPAKPRASGRTKAPGIRGVMSRSRCDCASGRVRIDSFTGLVAGFMRGKAWPLRW